MFWTNLADLYAAHSPACRYSSGGVDPTLSRCTPAFLRLQLSTEVVEVRVWRLFHEIALFVLWVSKCLGPGQRVVFLPLAISTEWSTIPACPTLMCFFNRGDTEGTNSSKILCPMFVYVLFYVGLCLG